MRRARLDEDGSTLYTLHDSGRLIRTSAHRRPCDHDGQVRPGPSGDEPTVLIVSPLEGLAAVIGLDRTLVLGPAGEITTVPVGGDASAALSPDGRTVVVPSCPDRRVRVVSLIDGAVSSEQAMEECLSLLDVDHKDHAPWSWARTRSKAAHARALRPCDLGTARALSVTWRGDPGRSVRGGDGRLRPWSRSGPRSGIGTSHPRRGAHRRAGSPVGTLPGRNGRDTSATSRTGRRARTSPSPKRSPTPSPTPGPSPSARPSLRRRLPARGCVRLAEGRICYWPVPGHYERCRSRRGSGSTSTRAGTVAGTRSVLSLTRGDDGTCRSSAA